MSRETGSMLGRGDRTIFNTVSVEAISPQSTTFFAPLRGLLSPMVNR